MNRRTLIAPLAVLGLVLAACGDDESGTTDLGESSSDSGSSSASGSSSSSGSASEPAEEGAEADNCAAGLTINEGVLTVGTSDPAFPPYVIDNDPTTGDGFESAVAYAIGAELGFEADSVEWVRTTFDEAIQPGPKTFDINLQQYSITPERAENITFSAPYYTSNQAIVGLDGSAAEGATSVSELQAVKFGAQAGTTSLQFITDVIQPDQDVFVYDDNAAAKAALDANQVDAIVLDLPTAFYVSAVEIEGSSVIAQFPVEAGADADEFGAVLELDNPLVDCIDAAIASLTESGELESITTKWMSTEQGAPILTLD